MKRLAPCVAVIAGLLGPAVTPGWAQPVPRRFDPQSRAVAPGRPPSPQPSPPVVTGVSPLLTQSPAVRVQPRTFNLDTAMARLFADHRHIVASGDFQLTVPNAGRVEVTSLPLTLQLSEGRIRTELDLSSVPMRLDGGGPFTAIRVAGISRIITFTMATGGVRLTRQVFPEAQAFVEQPLADEDMPALIRLEKRPLGRDPTNGLERFAALLTYPNGEKREARVWDAAVLPAHPAQIEFNLGDALVTVRIRNLQGLPDSRTREGAQQIALLFEVPKGYLKATDLDVLLQRHSAQRTRGLR